MVLVTCFLLYSAARGLRLGVYLFLAEFRIVRSMCGSWHRSGGWDGQGSRFDKTIGLLVVLLILTGLTGCGTLKSQSATQQLLLSDAVDRSIASIDFSPLSGKTVFIFVKIFFLRGIQTNRSFCVRKIMIFGVFLRHMSTLI